MAAKTATKSAKNAAPTASPVPGIAFVQELEGIKEYTLTSNGLRILLVPDDSVPVAGVMVTYHVGSKNEGAGYTGSAHLLEHLLFKGSEKFNHEMGTNADSLLESRGAILNASTWYDRTNYYTVLPAASVHLPIEIEADRMRTARFIESERASEMPIVRSEYEWHENRPGEVLDNLMFATAFEAHPYHHPVIGWKTDIENVSTERLHAFYNEFYWPNNATITVAGSFNEKEVLNTIKKEFGRHTTSPHAIQAPYTEEPPQQGQRRVTMKRAGTNTISLGYKIPSARHADMPALLMLTTILAGDKTSRLYRSFIDSAKATDASSTCTELYDPSLMITSLTLAPGVTHANAEKMLVLELENIKKSGISSGEITRAKRAIRRYMATRRDGAYALLSAVNEDLAVGDWTRFVTLPEALAAVTAADVKRVAQTYLIEDQSVVGWFINTAT
jgi:zinc protease